MNWAQNSPVVHYGGGLAALLGLLGDSYRRSKTAVSRTDLRAAT
jgi:hypothetical protein